MEHVLVRYGEIGTKSEPVRSKMRQQLRQRVENRLEYDAVDFQRVFSGQGRIIVETSSPRKAARAVSEVPGVSSVSPCLKTEASIKAIKDASKSFEIGETFGVDARRAGEHEFGSHQVEKEVGACVEKRSGSSVDLDDPDTLLEVDIRFDDAYLFTERVEAVGGLPVGSQASLAAMISGGIDSPVAAFRAMKRGSPIVPIYFYNKPIAAEDHLIRFESVLSKLERFHPSRDWYYYRVDMEEVNTELMKAERGRMLLHRLVMFRTAEKIAEKEGLKGIVTGESLGQKSSQTASNLELTSSIGKPIHRPLVAMDKNEIVEEAKWLGTFEEATVDSACTSLAPDSPATRMGREDFEELKKDFSLEKLAQKAQDGIKKVAV